MYSPTNNPGFPLNSFPCLILTQVLSFPLSPLCKQGVSRSYIYFTLGFYQSVSTLSLHENVSLYIQYIRNDDYSLIYIPWINQGKNKGSNMTEDNSGNQYVSVLFYAKFICLLKSIFELSKVIFDGNKAML